MASFLLLFIPDDVCAVKDIWLVGDVFLKDMYHTLWALKIGSSAVRQGQGEGHNKDHSNELYIHQMYNVKTFYTSKSFNSDKRENSMARMINALVRALNDPLNMVLPRMIIIMPHAEFLRMMNYHEFGISMMIGRCLEWFMRQIYRTVTMCHDSLKRKCLGAVLHYEPKIIWLKMVENTNQPMAPMEILKSKYNAILDQVCQQEGEGFVLMPMDKPVLRYIFNRSDSMSHDGRIAFWRSFSAKIKDFDEQKDSDDPPHPNDRKWQPNNECISMARCRLYQL